MKKIFSLFAAVLMAGSMMAGVLVSYSGEATLPAGVKISGTTVQTKVTNYNCLQFKNGYTGSGVFNGNAIILNAEGGFKAGDTLTISGFINNSDAKKYAQVQLFTVDAENACKAVWTSDSLVNNFTDATMTIPFQSYVLESDMDSIMLGRLGGTGANLKYIAVTRPEAAAINYWLVGTAAENGWDQTKAMPMANDQIVRHLAAGTYEFKVLVAEGSWDGALGAADVNATASSANWYGDGNVCFELANESDVTIAVAEGKIVLTGTFKEQVKADYYIKFAGNGWTWVPMTKVVSGNYICEGVWGGTGANVNTSMSDNGAAWFPEANITFLDESMEELPVPAVGTEGIYVYMPYEKPVLAFVYEAPAPKWDGTVTLSKTSIKSVADFNGVTLTFNGATKVEFLGGDADIIALENKNGSEMYAAWHPEYGGSYTIEGNVVTLTGWYDNTETVPLPKQNATLYVDDYGAFKIDGKAGYFETAEVAYEAAPATTYTVTYTVTGAVAKEAAAQAGYYNATTEGEEFVAGANTVPENMIAYVYAQMIEGYTCEVKVNDVAVTLTDGYWEGAITADMTIAVNFKKGEGGNTTISKTMLQVVNENKYTVSSGSDVTCYTSFKLNDVVTISTTGEPNCGSFWTNSLGTDWRLYQAKNGNVTITLAAGYELVSITIDYTNSNDGELTGLPYNTKDTNVSGSTKTYTVGNSGTKTNGQVRIQSITVEYKKGTSTDIQNTKAVEAVKALENGKVVIIKNGVKYNVMGQKF